MKYSKYNSIIHLNKSRYLLYNALSDRFLVLKSTDSCDIENQILKGGEVDLKSFSTNDHAQLKDAGIIIDDNTNETTELNNLFNHIDNHEDGFHLHLNPTMDCNFRCWYCYEKHLEDSIMSEDIINSILKYTENQISTHQNFKWITVSFFGGEPLIGFSHVIKPIISKIENISKAHNLDLYLQFTTNASLVDQDMLKWFEKYNCSFQITIDGSPLDHNKTRFFKGGTGSYQTIVNNIRLLASSGARVLCRVNYTLANIFGCEQIIDDLCIIEPKYRDYVRIDFQKVWQDQQSKEEIEQIDAEIRRLLEKANDHGFQYVLPWSPDATHSTCYGDKLHHVLINFNGDVYTCTARDFNEQNKKGKLLSTGIIKWDKEFREKFPNLKCSRESCINCRVSPLCGGGCKQRIWESRHTDGCLFNYNDEDKDKLILDHFEAQYLYRLSVDRF